LIVKPQIKSGRSKTLADPSKRVSGKDNPHLGDLINRGGGARVLRDSGGYATKERREG